MSWSIGYDRQWKRDIGYGVPAYCDHPGCMKEIDRGLSYVCGGDPHGGEYGCGLFFCGEHLFLSARRPQRCARCTANRKPFKPTPEHPTWVKWKLTDESWAQWRAENPEDVKQMRRSRRKEARVSEAICTCHCGGSMFYRHLHAESCVLSREGEEAPKNELRTLLDERDRLVRAIVWALGYTDFRAREQGEGAYWWRTELRLRAKLTDEQIDAILAATTPAWGQESKENQV